MGAWGNTLHLAEVINRMGKEHQKLRGSSVVDTTHVETSMLPTLRQSCVGAESLESLTFREVDPGAQCAYH